MSDNRVCDLVRRTFLLGNGAIRRETMDHEWAPVERWHLASDDPAGPPPRSVVVKSRRTGGSGWGYDPRNLIAERRALELLDTTGLAPRIYAADDELGAIVMEDIVGAQTVERVLFANDPDAAEASLVRLATAFGQMHAATMPIDPAPWHPDSILMTPILSAWKTLADACARLGFPAPGEISTELDALSSALADPAWMALGHGDAFPSNVLLAGERTVLIDFESANPRHIGIDGGGFALGFPAYRYWADLPQRAMMAMVDAWRAAILPGFPAVADDAVFFPMLATGALAWAILRLSRLPTIADDREPPDESHRRRSQIVATTAAVIETCRMKDSYPAITGWLVALDAAMRARWPEASQPRQFPAFNGGSRDGWVLVHDI